jgi:hypothetical protein
MLTTSTRGILAASLLALAAPLASAQPTIRSFTVDCGGGVLAAGNYRITASIGQHDVSAPLVGGPYSLRGGFLNIGACPPDFDLSGAVEVPDIFAFLSAWFAQDPRANYDGIAGITVPDIFAFLSAWFAGCS